ncbi:MAG: hypothetical protein ACI85I_001991 [Arenicella sp.]|jgi:hypothetical protein
MKNYLVIAIFGIILLGTSSCMKDQNKAPYEIEGVNLESERIYGGGEGADPRQLAKKYPDPTDETLTRIENIRTKLYPKPTQKGEIITTDSTAVDTETANSSVGEE